MRRPRGPARPVAACALLIGAGAGHELCYLLGVPRVGLALVAPALLAVLWLWRPGPVALGLVALALGIQLLLPLQTGGARVSDWVLHYEVSLRFAGQPSHALAAALPGRTPLFHQLNGAFLAHLPGFATYQVIATLLNSIWLWPAHTLIARGKEGDHRRTQLGLLALGLGPTLFAYVVYPWPWAFAAFFLLSALVFVGEDGPLAAAGSGLALAGALLAHPGSLFYVAGLGLYLMWRHRTALVPALAGGLGGGLTALPWLLDVTGGHPGRVLGVSILVRQNAGPLVWVVTRPLLWAATFLPTTVFRPPSPPEVMVEVFVLTLPGAVGAAYVLMRRHLIPAGAALCTIAVGVGGSWLAWPPNAWQTGMLDALYLGIVVSLCAATAAARRDQLRRLCVVNAMLLAVFLACLAIVSFFPATGDPNAALKSAYGVRFAAEGWGPAPGILIAAVGLARLALVARGQSTRR